MTAEQFLERAQPLRRNLSSAMAITGLKLSDWLSSGLTLDNPKTIGRLESGISKQKFALLIAAAIRKNRLHRPTAETMHQCLQSWDLPQRGELLPTIVPGLATALTTTQIPPKPKKITTRRTIISPMKKNLLKTKAASQKKRL